MYLIILAALLYGGYSQKDRILNFIKSSKQAIEVDTGTASARPSLPVATKKPQDEPVKLTPIQRRIQVEVLNGCGEQGIAKIIADNLRKRDYDVVNSGNYIEKGKVRWDVAQTRLIDQIRTPKNLANTKNLAKILGVSKKNIESYENPSPIADITIIIGKDFKTLSIFKKK